jgi:hypothetical protein
MRMLRLWDSNSLVVFAIAVSAILVLSGCDVKVNKDGEGHDKKVDIETPVGGLHVSKNADVRDTGLPVYPGARQKEKDDGDEGRANVNISSGLFGLRVVALEYLSDDPPDKLIAYYMEQLKKYGRVLQCHTSRNHTSATMDFHDSDDSGDSTLKCEGDDKGDVIELKVGTRQSQRIVSIRPAESGQGSDFGLVYIQMHGGKDTI